MSSRRGHQAPVLLVRPSGRRTGRTGTRSRADRPPPPGGTARENAGTSRQREPLDDVVVEADVADLDPAERGVDGRRRRVGRVDREAVVLRGDLDLAGERGPCTGWLMPRWPNAACRCRSRARGRAPGCRSRCRTAGRRAVEHLLHERDRVVGGGRVARAVAEEHAVGADRERARSSGDGRRAATCTSMPRSAICRGVIALMPRSSAATVKRFSPTAGTTYGCVGA